MAVWQAGSEKYKAFIPGWPRLMGRHCSRPKLGIQTEGIQVLRQVREQTDAPSSLNQDINSNINLRAGGADQSYNNCLVGMRLWIQSPAL